MTVDLEDEEPVSPVGILQPSNRQIFAYLRRVVEIGEYRGSWTEEDVARVSLLLCGGRSLSRRALAEARLENKQLQAEVAALRRRVAELEAEPIQQALEHAERVVMVSPLRARVIRDAISGRPTAAIARSLGLTPAAVTRHLQRTVRQTGEQTRQDALAQISSGAIAMVIRRGGASGG